MRNFVIINGVNSNTINGLGINELPPITKPEMRVQAEEIDGRDGDITTNLGYSAYDKTITIGLFGTGYDINDIVAFFNGEGTIVFSNEPDKYYNYKIISQIDYEKLQIFKTASITFHCQPFKYPLEEEPLEIEYEYVNGEGETITLDNTGESILKLDTRGQCKQDSTTGKNLLPLPINDTTTVNGITYTVDRKKGTITANGTATATANLVLLNPYNTNGETWFVSGCPSGGGNSTYTIYTQNSNDNGNGTGVNTSNGYIGVRVYQGYTANNVVFYPMLEKGSSKTDFEPYTGGQPSPSPDYPQQIHEVSGDNEVVVCGKNLLNLDRTLGTPSDTTTINTTKRLFDYSKYVIGISVNNYYSTSYITSYSVSNNSISVTNTNGAYGLGVPVKVEANKTYKLSYSTSASANQNVGVGFYSSDGTNLSFSTSTGTNNYLDITTPNNCDFMVIVFRPPATSLTYSNIMLNEGSSALTYEPYNGDTYELSLGDIKMRGIGTYEDYFVRNSDGQWCKYNAIGKVVLDGSENWVASGSQPQNGLKVYYSSDIQGIDLSSKPDLIYCNILDGITTSQYSSGSKQGVASNLSGGMVFDVCLLDTSMTLATWETFLGETNMIVNFPLATPYLSLIENTTLISQLDKVEKALAKQGQTNISQVNDDKPFIISAKALEDGTNEVVVNNIGNIYSKPLIALEGNGNVDIYLDNTQILRANVEDKMNIDIAQLEAYNPDTMILLNRQVIGNYNSMTLQPGNNTIRIDGALDKATITNYTRYL